MHAFKSIGLLSSQPPIRISSWNELADACLAARETPLGEEKVARAALDRLCEPPGLPEVPQDLQGPSELLARLLSSKLAYAPGEPDMVLLSHCVVAAPENGGGEEYTFTSTLAACGEDTMARCVGLPVAWAASRVLDGDGGEAERGVVRPDARLGQHVLERLEDAGLGFSESVERGGSPLERELVLGLKSKIIDPAVA